MNLPSCFPLVYKPSISSRILMVVLGFIILAFGAVFGLLSISRHQTVMMIIFLLSAGVSMLTMIPGYMLYIIGKKLAQGLPEFPMVWQQLLLPAVVM